MKVLHVFKTYLPETVGGIEQVIYQMCQSTRLLGIEPMVLTLSAEANPQDGQFADHQVYRCRQDVHIASTGFSLSAITRLKALARQVDLVHYHFPWPFMDLAHALAGVDTPYVVSYHSDIVKQRLLLQIYRPLMRRFLAGASRVIVASPNYRDSSPVLQELTGRCSVIPYGADLNSYPLPSNADSWQKRFGGRFFLFLGVLRYYKGLHVLLNAMRHLDMPLLIAGSGPMEKELQATAMKLGLKQVHFLGRVSEQEKVELLQQCYAMVFPSHLRSEAFGISLLEAAMYGKPMISCEIGTGTTFINQANVTGLVVPPRDASALAAAMAALWQNPELAMQMGVAAQQRYLSVFSAEQMGVQLAALYRSVVRVPAFGSSIQSPVG